MNEIEITTRVPSPPPGWEIVGFEWLSVFEDNDKWVFDQCSPPYQWNDVWHTPGYYLVMRSNPNVLTHKELGELIDNRNHIECVKSHGEFLFLVLKGSNDPLCRAPHGFVEGDVEVIDG